MGLFSNPRGLKAEISFTPNPKATIQRKVQRYKRLELSLAKAVKRGDVHRSARLQNEMDGLAGDMLEQRDELEAMLAEIS